MCQPKNAEELAEDSATDRPPAGQPLSGLNQGAGTVAVQRLTSRWRWAWRIIVGAAAGGTGWAILAADWTSIQCLRHLVDDQARAQPH